MMLFCLLFIVNKKEAKASCAPGVVVSHWDAVTTPAIQNFVTEEFDAHRQWYIAILWEDNILPALMLMADQLTAVGMQQVQIIGSFMDAQNQMNAQQELQVIRAKAHKDYHPSTGMCQFGTNVKSLAASERKAELNAHVMSQRSQDRQLGNTNTAAANGPDTDIQNRLEQYRSTYCDPNDNNAQLKTLCQHSGGTGATDEERKNKDIDYARTVDYPGTLNVDFTDTTLKNDEEDLLALASNLYGHDTFNRMNSYKLVKPDDSGPLLTAGGSSDYLNARSAYLDMRALVAKRSVAENSFNAITSMKSAGTAGSRQFLEAILKELGLSDTNGPPSDTLHMLGMDDDKTTEIGVSYDRQMQMLTKTIYQNPDFYTNLYDRPANVERKRVAMQAIGLMQKFDLFKSYLRAEANMSVLLELAVEDLQEVVVNEASE